MRRTVRRVGLAGSAVLVGALAAAYAPAAMAAADDGLAMLRQLQPGSWTLRYREGSGPRSICVRSGLELIELQPRRGGCRRNIVEQNASELTVQNSCPGDGFTRTTIRRESEALVQIDSQGLRGGSPFALSAEARRTGPC